MAAGAESRGADWYPPHQPNCMGCGPDNPGGLGLRMRADGEGVAGQVAFGTNHEGAPGFAHGGAVATALDDALGMLLMRLGRAAVTRRLEVDYLRPCFIGRTYELVADCERTDGRKLWLAASLREGDHVVADARGLFIQVDAEHFLQGDPDSPVARRMADRERQLPWQTTPAELRGDPRNLYDAILTAPAPVMAVVPEIAADGDLVAEGNPATRESGPSGRS